MEDKSERDDILIFFSWLYVVNERTKEQAKEATTSCPQLSTAHTLWKLLA